MAAARAPLKPPTASGSAMLLPAGVAAVDGSSRVAGTAGSGCNSRVPPMSSSGGLLDRGVEIKWVACADGVDQGLEFGWWGCVGPGSPAALESGPGGEPDPDCADRLEPAGWMGLVGSAWAPSQPVPLSAWQSAGPRGRRRTHGLGAGEPGVPAERERAGDQGLVAADRGVGTDLEVGPPESVLDLLVALFDPVSDAVDPYDFVQVGGGFGAVGLAGAAGAGQVGGQVPGGLGGQCVRVRCGHDQADVSVESPPSEVGVGGPPGLGVPVAEDPLDGGPVAGCSGSVQVRAPAASAGV